MKVRILILALLWSAPAAVAFAQVLSDDVIDAVVVPASTTTYGTLSETVYVIGAWDFDGYNSAVTTDGQASYRFVTAGAALEAVAHLPNGARVISMELEGCDTSASSRVRALFMRCPEAGNGCWVNAGLSTGIAETPGCGRYLVNLNPAEQVDNSLHHYLVQVDTGPTGDTKFGAVRLRYKLQVSPAPTTATFNDVPVGHPFHRFVEALALAGITAGCGGGNYCPDAAVTRGQIAVMLSAALGLHWPN